MVTVSRKGVRLPVRSDLESSDILKGDWSGGIKRKTRRKHWTCLKIRKYEVEFVAIKPSFCCWNLEWKHTLPGRVSCPFQVPHSDHF